jgi:hypothetical protein
VALVEPPRSGQNSSCLPVPVSCPVTMKPREIESALGAPRDRPVGESFLSYRREVMENIKLRGRELDDEKWYPIEGGA